MDERQWSAEPRTAVRFRRRLKWFIPSEDALFGLTITDDWLAAQSRSRTPASVEAGVEPLTVSGLSGCSCGGLLGSRSCDLRSPLWRCHMWQLAAPDFRSLIIDCFLSRLERCRSHRCLHRCSG